MKKRFILLLLLTVFLSAQYNAVAQDSPIFGEGEKETTTSEGDDNNSGMNAGLFVGSVTLGGTNYSQIGFRGDFPIGKFGLGLDVLMSIGPDGKIRKEDWDDFGDYIDKLYYIRWAQKGAPFYFKFGGLEYSYMGYKNIINGYTNMLEYPTVKRWGLETSFKTENFGGEFFLSDFKELFETKPSTIIGARLYYNVMGKLAIGASFATDINEYNALKDADGDGYPDEIDEFDYDDNLVTQYESYVADGYSKAFLKDAVDKGIRKENGDVEKLEEITKINLPKYGDSTSTSFVWSLDVGYPVIDGDKIKLNIYSDFTKINNYGWGITAPGITFDIGKFFTLKAEYKMQSKEFSFGYFNETYELERANFFTRNKLSENGNIVLDDQGNPITEKYVRTRSDLLKDITEDMKGYFAGLTIHFGKYADLNASYQDLRGSNDVAAKTLRADFGLTKGAIPKLPIIKGYYIQNNVQDFKELKTPQTVAGFMVGYNVGGVTMGFDYKWTFQDIDGSGKIDMDNETIKTIAVKTSISF